MIEKKYVFTYNRKELKHSICCNVSLYRTLVKKLFKKLRGHSEGNLHFSKQHDKIICQKKYNSSILYFGADD